MICYDIMNFIMQKLVFLEKEIWQKITVFWIYNLNLEAHSDSTILLYFKGSD